MTTPGAERVMPVTCPGCGTKVGEAMTLQPLDIELNARFTTHECPNCGWFDGPSDVPEEPSTEQLNRDRHTYKVNEIYRSIQGEGLRAGTVNVFVRFSACNMRCDIEPGPKSPGGFACDTEFESGRMMTAPEIRQAVIDAWGDADRSYAAVIFTGGEPGLQLDEELCNHLGDWFRAIETNGTVDLREKCGRVAEDSDWPMGLDWITLSPKVAEHAVKVPACSEIKYVRHDGQAIPKPISRPLRHNGYLISPATSGTEFEPRSLKWCCGLVEANPKWRLSPQLHKIWNAR